MWDSSWCAKGDAELKLMFFLLVSVGMAICFLLRGGFVCLFANGHSVLQCSEGFVVGFSAGLQSVVRVPAIVFLVSRKLALFLFPVLFIVK